MKIKNHEAFGTVIGQRVGDRELPEAERTYQIHVDEETLYRHPSDVEVIEEPTPEHISRYERHERFMAAVATLLASKPPYDQNIVKVLCEHMKDLGFMRRRG